MGFCRLLVASFILLISAHAPASTVVVVNGSSGPWDVSLNPAYPYGVTLSAPNINLPPTVVGSSADLPMTVGDTLVITYLDGKVLAGAGGSAWSIDASGVGGWGDSHSPGNPAWYVPGASNVNLETLMGVFASSGVIVGDPFIISNGPRSVVIPAGANSLQLGFTDGWYNDNGGSLRVTVSEIAAIPEPETYAMLLAGFGMLGFFARRRKRNAA
jgi:hypothetical protein